MKKNIWIWNHYASDMYRNRGGRHYWFAKNLIEAGYKVTIFCSNTFHNSTDVIPIKDNSIYEVKELDQIKFIFIKTLPFNGNGIKRILNMYDFYKNIKKVATSFINRIEKPDYILASSVHPLTMLAGVQIGKKYDIPCISEIRDLWPEAIFQFGYLSEKNPIGKLLIAGEKYIYENSDALIFTKPGDKDYLLENKWDINQGGKINLNKVHYINNGVELSTFDYQKENVLIEDPDLRNGIFKIIYTGTIKPVNNIDLILDTAKKLADYDDILFLVYGSGSEENRIRERINNENIANVKLKGRVEKEKIPYILSNSSVNLLNYSQKQYNWKRGNSSNKLFEYMASAKPIISTVKMGYSLIDKYQCGVELEQNNSEHLAKAILSYYNMSSEKYETIANNSRKASMDYDFKSLSNQLINVINSI